MSIEGARNAHDIVSLRDHFEALMTHYREAHSKEHQMLMANVELARQALDSRLESMNQFRSQIAAERATYITRDTYEDKHEVLSVRVEANEKRLSQLAVIGSVILFIIAVLEFGLRFVLK
jgi:hypothetical protein